MLLTHEIIDSEYKPVGLQTDTHVITVRHLPSLFPVTQQQDAGCESDVPADVFVFLKTEKQQKY